ncbi:hypothetical protein TH53_25535 [Pedobacter lusitanus]|uniref:Uncharacterized protein n=1 Tax=Pedobacter lusitanus TaxID=1503925 RepID=A0A0D0GJJ2_9SPHI|nr:hypothetical protein [Pedobacter lusitanus]KIO74596.1 hypothetical protein TH53_25535 [Pedobacter lusitanus]
MTSFLAYAKTKNRVLKHVDGIIMYPFEETPVPQYVYFMPKKLTEEDRLGRFFEQQFLYLPDIFYVLYFNPIRWILPDLGALIHSLDCRAVGYGKDCKLFQLSYGRITFDITSITQEQEEQTVFRVPLYIGDTNFFINVVELPGTMGTPKLFEKVDFNW